MIAKPFLSSLALAALSMSTSACATAAVSDVDSANTQVAESTEQQIATIMKWWDGDYNNDRHLKELEAADKPIWRKDGSGKGGHIEVTSHYRPVTLPAFGDNVIYVEETKHGDPDNIFRQRIYTLTADAKINAVRVKLWYFSDKKKYVGAFKDISIVKDLTPKEMFKLPDTCDMIVRKQGDKYHMPMPDKDCVFGESYFNYQVLLGKDSFWFRDRIMNVADDTVKESAGNFTYHKLDRITQ